MYHKINYTLAHTRTHSDDFGFSQCLFSITQCGPSGAQAFEIKSTQHPFDVLQALSSLIVLFTSKSKKEKRKQIHHLSLFSIPANGKYNNIKYIFEVGQIHLVAIQRAKKKRRKEPLVKLLSGTFKCSFNRKIISINARCESVGFQ